MINKNRSSNSFIRFADVLLVVVLLAIMLPPLVPNQLGKVAQAAAIKCSPNLGNVPQVNIPDHPEWKTVYDYAWLNWKNRILSNSKQYNQCWMDEGFGAGGATWQWDTLYGTLGARWAYYEFPAIETQENFYYAQDANGFIGQKLSEQGPSWKASSLNPPFFAWVEWEYYLMSGDASHFSKVINGPRFSGTVLQHLIGYFNYMWNNTAIHRADGYWVWTGIDSGRDCVSGGLWIDLPAQMAAAAFYTARIAQVVGDTTTQLDMQNHYTDLATFLNSHHWNSSRNFYESLNTDTTFITNMDSPQGFWPMVSDVASDQQVAAIVAQVLNPGKFFPYHPVPSMAVDSPYYNAGCKWMGPTWPPDTITAEKGLALHGQRLAAYQVALQDVLTTVTTYEGNGGHLCESYKSNQSGCYGNTDLTWSSAGYVVSLLDFVMGFQPEAPNDAFDWTVSLVEPYSVTGLHFGNNVVSLSSARRAGSEDGARVTVTTDSPFNLTVHVAGATCIQSMVTGTTTFDCGEYRGGGLTETPTITPTDPTSTPTNTATLSSSPTMTLTSTPTPTLTSTPTSTHSLLLTPPILLSPADGVTVSSRIPIFTWGSVTGATGYTIQIGKNSNFTLLVGTYDVTAATYKPSSNLPKGTLYWRVRANGPEGSSNWSVSRSLVVQ